MNHKEVQPKPIPSGFFWVETAEGDGWLVPQGKKAYSPQGAAEEVARQEYDKNDHPEHQRFEAWNPQGNHWTIGVTAEVEITFRGRILD